MPFATRPLLGASIGGRALKLNMFGGASPNVRFNSHPGALAGSLVGFAADTGGTLG